MKTASLFIPLLTAAFVSAHGFLQTVTINGQAYTGNSPLNPTKKPSSIRAVDTYLPIQDVNSPALTCGSNSTAGARVANANPGDEITFYWESTISTKVRPFVKFFFCALIVVYFKWPHNTGPILTYLANCGSSPCSQFDITNSKWFKIDQIGRKSPGSAWAQADLSAFSKTVLSISHFIDISFSLVVTGGVATASLPRTLAPGNYLLRHEIIALQNAVSIGGAEFYEGCIQMQVGGSETGGPTPDELVSIPGAYNAEDPGIHVDVYTNPNTPYVFPGPHIANFVGATTSGTSSSGTSSSSAISSSSGTPFLRGKPSSSAISSSSATSSSGNSSTPVTTSKTVKTRPTSSAV